LTENGHGRNAATMSTKDDIINKLREAFVPESLDVVDESHLHEGHSGHRPGGETHFRVHIVSPAFEGKTRIERHRMINTVLDAELKGSVHALAIKAKSPGETAPGETAPGETTGR
jgi:BolA protein